MSRRASAAAQTRRRIVDATRELHGEQGIAATSWDDIAARAGVGVGTVYRHFPSLDQLVPACGQVSMEIIALPDPQDAPARFDGLDTPAERIAALVQEAFAIYERGAPQLFVIRHEAGIHPSLAQAGEEIEASLTALVDSALDPLDVEPRTARSPARWSTSAPGRRSATRASRRPRRSRPSARCSPHV
jgi:AcrR family transcriptional regulator